MPNLPHHPIPTIMTSTSFSEAQQRIIARRQARESALRTPTASPRPRSLLGTITSRLPAEQPTPSFRVNQLEAEQFDEGLLQRLSGHVADGLKYFGNGHAHEDWEAEVSLVLRAALFKFTVWDNDATYGAAIQQLRFSDARRGGRWLWRLRARKRLCMGW